LNLLGDKKSADYVNTGQWSKKAIGEAKKLGGVNVAASGEANGFTSIPARAQWTLDPNAAYVHYTANETIGGVEFQSIPDVGGVPLVTDASSTLLSRPLDVSRFGLIYAGAQKNFGPSGLALAIIRADLVGRAGSGVPSMLDYKVHAENESMFNTPPTYAWYIAGLVFEWLKTRGGLKAMAQVNERKARKLYDYIDASGFYKNPVAVSDRSWMNIPFTLADSALDDEFLKGAKGAGLLQLKGHRSVGGMRASIYNAMPESAIDALIDYMKSFVKKRG
jgi:phosphoserine aminotransferase